MGSMSDILGSFDFEEIFEQNRATMQKTQEVQEQMRELVGRAESEDGHISVTYGQSGLDDLHLDSRAMRMASEDLAAEIKKVVHAASENLREQTNELFEQIGPDQPVNVEEMVDPEFARKNLESIGRMFRDSTGSATDLADRLKRTLGI